MNGPGSAGPPLEPRQPRRSPTLTVECAGATYYLRPERSPALIGRGANVDIALADPRVSPVHMRLDYTDRAWRATDADSRTGMFVAGVSRRVVDITDGLTIRVGDPAGTPVTFRTGGFDDQDDRGDHIVIVTSAEGGRDAGAARAGAAVAARRRELDITQRTLAKYRIMNAGALIAFEKGRSWPRERTRAKLEEVLQWPPGAIADIRNGGTVPGERAEGQRFDDAPLIVGAVDVAMKTFEAAVAALPEPSHPDFAARAAVIAADLRQLETIVARAARQSSGTPALVMALSAVRTSHQQLMHRAAATPGATLGQRLFAARGRANLSVAETAGAIGVSPELVQAVEAGVPVTDAAAAHISAFLVQLHG